MTLLRDAMDRPRGEPCTHGAITRHHSCADHEPCEGCVVGFWCDDHDGIRCEQWFAGMAYARYKDGKR